jgi:2-amino-4-hydroxy-6-hydroxymethyldihydropteridine diphosphokinase
MIDKELFILLGTNLGDRFQNLETASVEIENSIGKITRKSSIYQTAAWGFTDQPSFLNQVLQLSTDLPASNVLQIILKIEKKMGRVREQKWGARLIDIDILYFANEIIKQPGLIVPHPFLQERRFALIPLTEILPDFIHPILKMTNLELLEKCKDELEVILIEN